MSNKANNLIDLIERFEWKENVHEDEKAWDIDYQIIKSIITDFIKDHGLSGFRESEILDALPVVLLNRKVTYLTFDTISQFCDYYDPILYPEGYFGMSLEEELDRLEYLIIKLQNCAKRFVKRNRQTLTKYDPQTSESCAICIGPLNLKYNKPTPCGHFFHAGCIRKWKQRKSSCPMCRSDLE